MGVRRWLAAICGLAVVMSIGSVAAAVNPQTSMPSAAEGSDYGRMMLVLDSSGSMKEAAGGGQSKIQAARGALNTVVDELPDDAEVGLRVFGATVFSRNDKGACEDTQQVVAPGTDNRDDLRNAVGDYKPYGETPIPAALKAAADDLGSEGARSIVLVSDGESTCAPNPCQVAKDLAGSGIDLQINVVGLSVSGKARQQLECIADNGNGTYYDADGAKGIAGALEHVSTRSLRPFSLSGTPIEGGTEDDPTPIEVGDYTDTLGTEDGGLNYVFERTTPGTTIRASVIGQGDGGDNDLHISITDPEGQECTKARGFTGVDTRRVVGVEAAAGPDDVRDCSEPGQYLITVDRVAAETDLEVGIRVTEEPPVEDPGFVAEDEDHHVDPQVSGEATEVVGGTSFTNAGEIGDGRWKSNIVPGESALYRFPLEFGQAARIKVIVPPVSGYDEAGLTAGDISLANPMRAQLDIPRGANTRMVGLGTKKVVGTTSTPPISRELDQIAGVKSVQDFSMSGEYTLAVSAEKSERAKGIEIPFTIELEIVGDPQDGPTYADGASWTVADDIAGTDTTGDDGDSEGSDNSSDAAPDDTDEVSGSKMAGLLLGAAGAAALIGALVLWRRRRTS